MTLSPDVTRLGPRPEPGSAGAGAAAPAAPRGLSPQVLLSSAAAVATALSLWAGAAWSQEAQDAQSGAQAQDTGQDAGQDTAQAQPSGGAEQAGGGQGAPGDASDALLATVGDAEIRNSDLLRAIGALPAPLNQQPPDMVAAAAFQQLLMREAILQEARAQGLAQDPEVQSLVADATGAAEDAAMVQVWLQRELEGRVGSEAVDQAYAGLQAVAGADLPPLEQIRPQIEASLRQQAMDEIQAALLTGADITFYGPDGQPRTADAGASGGQAAGDASTGNAADSQAQPSQDGTGEGASDGQASQGEAAPADGGTTDADASQADGTTGSDAGQDAGQDAAGEQPSDGGN